MIRAIWITLALLLLLFGIFTWASFFGFPWKKASVADELEEYVEEKYDITVTQNETFYNFKSSSYGATFTEDATGITFRAEKYVTGTLHDEYVEERWAKEAADDIDPILNQFFKNFSIERHGAYPVYGMANDLAIVNVVPNYKELHTGIGLMVHFQDTWTDEKEEELLSEVADFVRALQEEGIRNLSLHFYMENEASETFYIELNPSDWEDIGTTEELLPYITSF